MNEIVDVVVQYWLYWGIPLAFLAVAVWIYRPSAKRRYKADGDIPFEETEMKTRRGNTAGGKS